MTNALEIKGLRKVYKGGFEALKGIDLTVQEGDFYALLGPNGAALTPRFSSNSTHCCCIFSGAADKLTLCSVAITTRAALETSK